MKIFGTKKQEEKLKEVPLLEAKKEVHHTLSLLSLKLVYSLDRVQKYSAMIEYAENPSKGYGERGSVEEVVINADNWNQLVDKVSAHFNKETK